MKALLAVLVTVLLGAGSPVVIADACKHDEIVGTWTIFHKAIPKADLHLAEGSILEITRKGQKYAVTLEDKSGWAMSADPVIYFCNSHGKVILLVSIVKETCTHQVTLSRVPDSDLAYHKDKKSYPPNQIEFYQYGHLGECAGHRQNNTDKKVGDEPNSPSAVHAEDQHPGHIHGDKD